MCRTFNMGIGLVAIVDDDLLEDVMQQLTALGETPFHIGEITARPDTKNASPIEIDCL
jgi:phosphoribosylaminoimidazole (AIR) synthetase